MSVTIDLAGRKALVTGASRGIGRRIAERLAEAGAAVALTARDAAKLEEVAAGIRAKGGTAVVVAAAATDSAAVDAAVAKADAELGGLDFLVNNAGVTRDGLLVRMSDEAIREVLDVNLTGAMLFTRAAAKLMMKRRFGRIVCVSSVVGLRGNAGQANYAASKAGLIGFAKSVARELAGRGVTANVVAPGFIETDMTAGLGDAVKQAALASIPQARFGTAEEVADAVLFLVSPLAAYVTGEVLRVDGGMAA